MIVTSKRCFLNVLTQLCDLETLINANYYIADIRSSGNIMTLDDDRIQYSKDGKFEVITPTPRRIIGKYNIKYDNEVSLDPTPYICSILSNIHDRYKSPDELFKDHLLNTDTLINVYSFLFKDEVKDNGLQIVIFNDEDTVVKYCHIVCEYLSSIFGVDILFIDPEYRSDVKGVSRYTGCDTETARNNIMKIRDEKLLRDFRIHFAYTTPDMMLSNLTSFLIHLDCPSLIHLYNLLFPSEPLPPDNYTSSQLREIIIGKSAMVNQPKQALNNIIFSNTQDFFECAECYDEDEDEEEY